MFQLGQMVSVERPVITGVSWNSLWPHQVRGHSFFHPPLHGSLPDKNPLFAAGWDNIAHSKSFSGIVYIYSRAVDPAPGF